MAREIVEWKENFASRWDGIQVLGSEFTDSNAQGAARTGDSFDVRCTINTNGLGESLGVELVMYKEKDGVSTYVGRKDLAVTGHDGTTSLRIR